MLSHEAAYQVKELGEENDLIERVRKDAYFDPIKDELDAVLDPRSFIGRAPQQVDKFIKEWVAPALEDPELKVLFASIRDKLPDLKSQVTPSPENSLFLFRFVT